MKEKIFTSYEELNVEIKKIVAALNTRPFQNRSFSRRDAFEKYDKPCMKPLPGGCYTVCDYRAVLKIPNNYHVEYDGHYYSVFYSYCGKPAIVKATPSEIRICDQYNKLICTHKRVYRDLPRYITADEHMPPEHLYYVNAPYQVPYKLKAASAALLHCFFGFLTTSSNFSDHGSRSSKNDRSLSSMRLGISVRRCSKYSYGFRLFAFAVSAML